MVMKINFGAGSVARISPLPLPATASPAANRERSSDDINVVGRVRALASSWMSAPSPDTRGLASASPEGRGEILVPSHVRRGRVRVGDNCAARLAAALHILNPESLVPHPPLADERRPPPTNGRGKVHSTRHGAAFLLLALSGCSQIAPAPVPRPVMVEVPVATPIYCTVPVLNPPVLAIAALTPDSAPADTVRSYAATVDVLKSAVRERDSLLEGCAAPSSTSPPSMSPPPPSPAPQTSIAIPPAPPKTAQVSIASRLVSTIGRLVSW